MKVIHTKGEIKDGKLIANDQDLQDISDEEVDVIVISEKEADEFEVMRKIAREKGYDSQEKIMDLIHQVKLEKLQEKGRSNS